MRIHMLVGFLFLALAAAHTPAVAQPAPVSIKQVSDAGGAVTVVVTVLDATGRPVTGLTAGAFAVRLDGTSLALDEVRFAADPETGLGVVVAIDVSGSMAGPRLDSAKRAAAAFLDTLAPADQVALIAFNQEVAYFADFTADRATVKGLIGRLGAAGNTALYRATVAAVEKAVTASLPRKAVVLITDGENFDPGGAVSREQALAAAVAAGVPVYAIGLGRDVDQPYLDELARVTRGASRFAPGPTDLDRLVREISESLRGQYVLRARPVPVSRAAGHTLRVTVALDGGPAFDEVTFAGAGLPLLPDPTPAPPPPTPVAVVTPEPAPVATPRPIATAAPVTAVSQQAPRPWAALLLVSLALLGGAGAAAALWWRRRRRTPRPAPVIGPTSPSTPLPTPAGAALPTATPAVIQVLGGPLAGLEVPITTEPLTLGTGEDCRVVLSAADGHVERRHARIWHRDGRYMLHRLARSAPVTVNGQPVQWVVLEPDDEVVIGPHRIRFHVRNGVAPRVGLPSNGSA